MTCLVYTLSLHDGRVLVRVIRVVCAPSNIVSSSRRQQLVVVIVATMAICFRRCRNTGVRRMPRRLIGSRWCRHRVHCNGILVYRRKTVIHRPARRRPILLQVLPARWRYTTSISVRVLDADITFDLRDGRIVARRHWHAAASVAVAFGKTTTAAGGRTASRLCVHKTVHSMIR